MTSDDDSARPADPSTVDELLARAAATPPTPGPDVVARITAAATAAAADVLDQAEAAPDRNRGAATGVEPTGRRGERQHVEITGAQVAAWRDGQADPPVAAAIQRALRLGDPRVLALQARLDEADRLLAHADTPEPSPSRMRRLRVAAMDAARDHLDATTAHAGERADDAPAASTSTGHLANPTEGLRARLAGWLGSGTALRVAGGLATIAVVAALGIQVLPQGASDSDGAATSDLMSLDEQAAAPDDQDLTAAEEARQFDVAATDAAGPEALSGFAVSGVVDQLGSSSIVGTVNQTPVVRLDEPVPPELLVARSLKVDSSILRTSVEGDPGEAAVPALDGAERAAVRACMDSFVARPDLVERIALAVDEAGVPSAVVVLFPARLLVLDVADCG